MLHILSLCRTGLLPALSLLLLPLHGSCVDEPAVGSESAAIVGGSATTDYPAVAQISMTTVGSEGTTYSSCSSTLISPRVLLTAAHCLDSADGTTEAITAYFGTRGGQDPDFIQSIPASDWTFYTPWNLSGNDIALVLLEYDSDVVPMAYNTQVLGNGDIGANLHVVGWGNTAVDVGSGTKRHMNTPISGFQSNLVLNYGDASANTCQGDSGGPGFVSISGVERVAGVTSFGTNGCSGYSGSTRVAQYASYIANYISANDIPQPPVLNIVRPLEGAEVSAGFQIQIEATDNTRLEKLEVYVNGQLVAEPPVNIPPFIANAPVLPDGAAVLEVRATDNRGDVTTKSVNVTVDSTCDGPQDCGGVLLCNESGMCVAPDYGLGSVCENSEECETGLCATVEGASLCTSSCVPGDSSSCPADFACLTATETEGYCWPDEGGGESGGCSTGGGTSGLLGGFFLLFALAWRRRRE